MNVGNVRGFVPFRYVEIARADVPKEVAKPLLDFATEAVFMGPTQARKAAESLSVPQRRGYEQLWDTSRVPLHDNVVILYGGEGNPARAFSAPHLVGELLARGAVPRLMNTAQLEIREGGTWYYQGRLVPRPEAVMSRGVGKYDDALDLLQKIEDQGIHVVNRAGPIRLSRNKWETAKVYKQHELAHPRTEVATSRAELDAAAARIGYPVFIKKTESSGGHDAFAALNREEQLAIGREHLSGPGPHEYVVQNKLETEGPPTDFRIRVHRLADPSGPPAKVTGIMKRWTEEEGVYVTNTSMGGQKARVSPKGDDPLFTAEDEAASIRTLDTFGLDDMGRDTMITRDVEKFDLEVNATSGEVGANMAIPRDEHGFPYSTDYAVFGRTRPRWSGTGT